MKQFFSEEEGDFRKQECIHMALKLLVWIKAEIQWAGLYINVLWVAMSLIVKT